MVVSQNGAQNLCRLRDARRSSRCLDHETCLKQSDLRASRTLGTCLLDRRSTRRLATKKAFAMTRNDYSKHLMLKARCKPTNWAKSLVQNRARPRASSNLDYCFTPIRYIRSQGAHAKVIETWDTWADRAGFRARAKSPAAARRFLERRLNELHATLRQARVNCHGLPMLS